MLEYSMIIACGVTALLLICSALISGSEVAFFSMGPGTLEDLENSKSRSERKILQLLERPKKLLATILIANNFVNVAIIILSTYIVDNVFAGAHLSEFQQFLIQVVAVTFIILFIGEVTPKVYATRYSLKLARFMALPMSAMMTIFTPLSKILIASTSIIDKRIKRRGTNISVDHLEQALDLTQDDETDEQEHKMLRGIVRFGNTDVKQIMKPRTDVVAIEDSTPYTEIIDTIIDCGYSRIPVYRESFDEVKGVLYIKDLLAFLDKEDSFEWQELVRPAMFVPENKKLDDLFREFQESKVHLAIVVDEYGGTSGIVTLEDILEEIVGDITDEFDEDNLVYSKLDDKNFVIEGKTPLIDVYRILNISGEEFEDAKGESDTLAGFLIEQSGKILKKNEKMSFDRYTFTIEAADKRRVKRIKVTIEDEVQEVKEKKNGNGGSKSMGMILLLISLSIGFQSCEEEKNYTPKPRGYIRIDLPEGEHQYRTFKGDDCPIKFEFPAEGYVEEKESPGNGDCFKNVKMPNFDATVYLTYKSVGGDLPRLIQESREFVNSHLVKATSYDDSMFVDTARNMYGLIYELKGNTASNLQFILTDSSEHFLRGSLMFYTRPNYDSILPVLKYVTKDVHHLINTLEWTEKS